MIGAVTFVAQALTGAVDDSSVSPGVLGFVVVASLGVGTWLLIRSMNRQIRKINIPEDDDADGPPGEESTPSGGDRDGSTES